MSTLRSASTVATALAVTAAVALAGGACSSDDGDDHGATYNCEAELRDEEFLAGMQKVGPGGVQVTLTSATPAPPSRDDNTWELDVAMGGSPLAGATVDVTPFMPDHNHGTSVAVVVTETAVVGRYLATPINLWMPGLWEITVEVTPAGGTRDEVVFRFCITG